MAAENKTSRVGREKGARYWVSVTSSENKCLHKNKTVPKVGNDIENVRAAPHDSKWLSKIVRNYNAS